MKKGSLEESRHIWPPTGPKGVSMVDVRASTMTLQQLGQVRGEDWAPRAVMREEPLKEVLKTRVQ